MRRWLPAVVLVGTLGCAPGGGENVLVVTLDTTRADHLGAYGYADARTPNFDRFGAERAVRFDRALSAAPLTFPSHTTIFTGTYPAFHGVHDNDDYRLDDGVTTLAEILQEAGYETAAFVSAAPLVRSHHLDQGFDLYDDAFDADLTEAQLLARTDLDFGFAERRSDQTNLAFGRWLEEHAGDRFFAWVHYFDPHQPHDLQPPYDSLFAGAPYDGEIAFMDESFGALLGMLEEKGVLDETLIVVVGDHGEGLFQHDESTHASFLYNATQHVPLWIASPRHRERAGESVATMVRTLDVTPTILDLLGLPPGDDVQGRSLRPVLEGSEMAPEPAMMETYYNWFRYGWAPTRALDTGEWKVIESPKPRLYRSQEDPDELHDLSGREPARVAELLEQLRRLDRRLATDRPDRSVALSSDPEVARQLESLGYLGGSTGGAELHSLGFPSPEELAALPDPSDHVLELAFSNSAAEMVRVGEYEQAVRVAREGLAVDPGNLMLRELLARGLGGMGLVDESLEVVNGLLEERPESLGVLRLLSRLRQVRGEDRELAGVLETIADLGVAEADDLIRLGQARARLGQHEEAVERYREAAELGEPDSGLLTDLGNSLVELGRGDEAVAAYQQALDLDPRSVRTRFSVGQLYLAAGNAEFARRMFEEILELDPNHLGARVFLARMDLAAGKPRDEVAPMLEKVVELNPDSLWAAQARELLATSGP
ncbi:MAG: sulfatase-like hydrolase/transferase [Thermoanaerobaculia bacterium]